MEENHETTGTEVVLDRTAYLRFTAKNPVGTILFSPALGVRAAFYTPLTLALAAGGYHVLVHELRGNGISPVRPGWGTNFGYATIINEDFPALVEAARKLDPSVDLVMAGHSLGGQLAALFCAKTREPIKALVLTACSTPHFVHYNGAMRYQIRYGSYLFQIIASLVGHFPGKTVGFGAREARALIHDWSRLARTGRFTPAGDDFNYEQALAAITIPILSIGVETDPMAPPDGIRGLNAKFSQHHLVEEILSQAETGRVNHFSWVKGYPEVATRITDWLAALG